MPRRSCSTWVEKVQKWKLAKRFKNTSRWYTAVDYVLSKCPLGVGTHQKCFRRFWKLDFFRLKSDMFDLSRTCPTWHLGKSPILKSKKKSMFLGCPWRALQLWFWSKISTPKKLYIFRVGTFPFIFPTQWFIPTTLRLTRVGIFDILKIIIYTRDRVPDTLFRCACASKHTVVAD